MSAPAGEGDSAAPPPALLLGAVALMLAATLMNTLKDLSARWLDEGGGLFQIVLVRGLVGLLPVLWLARREVGLFTRPPPRPALNLLRVALVMAAWLTFVVGLRYLPVAAAMSVLFTAPLIVAALSGPLLGDRVGRGTWLGIAVGFAGVLLVLRPGGEVVALGGAICLLAALWTAGDALAVRRLTRADPIGRPPLSLPRMLVYLHLGLITLGVLGVALTGWTAPDPLGWAVLVAVGLFGVTSQWGYTAAIQRAPAAVIIPFTYSGLLWGALIGWLIWGEQPHALTWAGAGIIIAGGLIVLRTQAGAGAGAAARRPTISR